MIRVQQNDFDMGAEVRHLSASRTDMGAVATFLGLVRDGGEGLSALTLEHYPGMTERTLAALEAEARRRWPVTEITIIHRFGRLELGEQIVLVAVLAAHRQAAFLACEFLMDRLKTQAPFWKMESRPDGERWVDAKPADDQRSERWGQLQEQAICRN